MSYHPTLGKWIERDPVVYDDTMDLTEYVRSNPVNFTDPMGLQGTPATTQASATQPSLPDLLKALDADDFKDREAARQRLSEMLARDNSLEKTLLDHKRGAGHEASAQIDRILMPHVVVTEDGKRIDSNNQQLELGIAGKHGEAKDIQVHIYPPLKQFNDNTNTHGNYRIKVDVAENGVINETDSKMTSAATPPYGLAVVAKREGEGTFRIVIERITYTNKPVKGAFDSEELFRSGEIKVCVKKR